MKKHIFILVSLVLISLSSISCSTTSNNKNQTPPNFTTANNAYVFSFANSKATDNIVFINKSSEAYFTVRLYAYVENRWVPAAQGKLKTFMDTDKTDAFSGRYNLATWYALVPTDTNAQLSCYTFVKHHDLYIEVMDEL